MAVGGGSKQERKTHVQRQFFFVATEMPRKADMPHEIEGQIPLNSQRNHFSKWRQGYNADLLGSANLSPLLFSSKQHLEPLPFTHKHQSPRRHMGSAHDGFSELLEVHVLSPKSAPPPQSNV